MTEIDLLRSADHNLAIEESQASWLDKLYLYDFVLTTPPCCTHSRAVWANSNGPHPIRSRKYPLGFPWLSDKDRQKADLFNGLIDFSWKVLEKVHTLSASQNILGFSEHPEDLGRVRNYRMVGIPASIWQSPNAKLLIDKGWWCGAFSQDIWGAVTPKPTRCIANSEAFTDFAPSSAPVFDSDNFYTGPVVKSGIKQKVSLMRRHGDTGPFRTSAAAAYPKRMCKQIVKCLFKGRALWKPRTAPTDGGFGASSSSTLPAFPFPPVPPGAPLTAACLPRRVGRFSHSLQNSWEKEALETKIKTLKSCLKVKLASRASLRGVGVLKDPGTALTAEETNLNPPNLPKWHLEEGVDYVRAGWYGLGSPTSTLKSPGRYGRPLQDGGGLCSPGRWPVNRRVLPDKGVALTNSLDAWMDARSDANSEDGRINLVNNILEGKFEDNPFSGELAELKFAWGTIFAEAGLVRPKAQRRAGLIIDFGFLYLAGAYLGDPDFSAMEEFCVGVRIGVDTPLSRTSTVWPAKSKWPLNEYGTEPVRALNRNYPSAATFKEALKAELDDQRKRGWVLDSTLGAAQERYGVVSIAPLAIIEEKDGKTRTLLDASNHVQVNNRIKVLDGELCPTSLDVQAGISSEPVALTDIVALVVDVEKAHQQIPISELDWRHVGCSAEEMPSDPALLQSWPIVLKTVGTYGVASASWHWARVASLFQRIAYYLCGMLYLFRFADDFMLLASRGQSTSYTRPILRFIALCGLFDIPLKWKKTRGGRSSEFVGYLFLWESLEGGMADRRAAWLCNWARTTAANGIIVGRDLRAALGRFAFSAALLRYLLPFLGPLYSWLAVIEDSSAIPLPFALVQILRWIADKVQQNPLVGLRVGKPRFLDRYFKADAKAEGEEVSIGGFEVRGNDNLKQCRWFAYRLNRAVAPWAYVKSGEAYRTIASLELFASLLCIMLFTGTDSAEGSSYMTFSGASDNQGNTALIGKGMTSKFPLYLILMEISEQLAFRRINLDLQWQRRDLNQAADDLTNGLYDSFNPELRLNPELSSLSWLILPQLYAEAIRMHEQIVDKKSTKALSANKLAEDGKRRKPFKRKKLGLRVTDPW